MGDIRNPKLLKLKGWMFLFLGTVAACLLIAESDPWKESVLIAICVWSFCRFYYFAFYVLEHYADPDFRYAGLFDLAKYLLGSKTAGSRKLKKADRSSI